MRDTAKTNAANHGYRGSLLPWRRRRQMTQEPSEAETSGITKEQLRSLFSKELGLSLRKQDKAELERARRIRSALYDPELR